MLELPDFYFRSSCVYRIFQKALQYAYDICMYIFMHACSVNWLSFLEDPGFRFRTWDNKISEEAIGIAFEKVSGALN